MENLEIGKLHMLEQHRDAVHMAIAPAVAGERMRPGMHVGFHEGKAYNSIAKFIGIVDPFLDDSGVKKVDKFWVFLYPGSITSLRHEWTHPSFQDDPVAQPAPISDAEREAARHVAERLTNSGEHWLREFCRNGDCLNYEQLIDAIKNGESISAEDEYGDRFSIRIGDEYISVGGTDAHGTIPDEFWDHVEAVTGKKQLKRPTYFSCSC